MVFLIGMPIIFSKRNISFGNRTYEKEKKLFCIFSVVGVVNKQIWPPFPWGFVTKFYVCYEHRNVHGKIHQKCSIFFTKHCWMFGIVLFTDEFFFSTKLRANVSNVSLKFFYSKKANISKRGIFFGFETVKSLSWQYAHV